MLTTVDRVLCRLSLKSPVPDGQTGAARDEATSIALHLLQTYQDQLSRRGLPQDYTPSPKAAN